jgi:hypothetical protein
MPPAVYHAAHDNRARLITRIILFFLSALNRVWVLNEHRAQLDDNSITLSYRRFRLTQGWRIGSVWWRFTPPRIACCCAVYPHRAASPGLP